MHESGISSVTYNNSGAILASGSYDSTIKLWNVEKLTEIATLSNHIEAVYTIAFSSNGEILASGSEDKTIKL